MLSGSALGDRRPGRRLLGWCIVGCGLGRWRGGWCAGGGLGGWLFGLVWGRVVEKTWLMVRLDYHRSMIRLKLTREEWGSCIIFRKGLSRLQLLLQ